MPLRRLHHINHRRVPRAGVIVFMLTLWITLGLISQAAFQLIG